MYINKDDLNVLLVCSFRYALTRHSYIPEVVEDLLEKYSESLHQTSYFVMDRDLQLLNSTHYSWAKLKHLIGEKINEC